MRGRSFLDTNILLHYLTGEDERKAERCLQLLRGDREALQEAEHIREPETHCGGLFR